MCDQQRLRSACAFAQSDQNLCKSLEHSMTVRLLIKHHLEFLSLKGGCTGWSGSTLSCQNATLLEITCHGTLLVSSIFVLFSFSGRIPARDTMQKNKTVCMYCISLYLFVAALIYIIINAFVSLSPVLPSYRSATEVTEALSNLFKYNKSYDRNATSLGASSVDISIAGNGGYQLDNTYQSCNMSQSHAMTFHCSHLIALVKCIGRTGNQMFEYAALLGVAHRHNYTAVISPNCPLTNVFSLPNVANINTSGLIRLRDDKVATYDKKFDKIDTKHNYELFGCFQSWRYFSEINEIIRRIYKVKDTYLKPAVDFLKRIRRRGSPNVCVHVRRGDFIKPRAIKRGFGFAGLGYIDKAMSYIKTRLNADPLFIVLSNDKEWCNSNLNRSNTVISPFDQAYEDLALMTLCDHVIMTSGTFGWWGAWLSNGTVVYYKHYPRPNSTIEPLFNRYDYYPASWVGLA